MVDETLFAGKITYIDGAEKIISKEKTKIKEKEFQQNKTILSISVHSNITEIKGWAFHNCSNLKNVVLPETLTEIGNWAFAYCKNLESVELHHNIKSIGKYAFSGCPKLKIKFNGSIEQWKELCDEDISVECGKNGKIIYMDETEGSIPYGKSSVEFKEFAYNNKIKSIILPETITTICDKAFFECENLADIFIPDSVVSIGKEAYAYCKKLKNIILPQCLSSIASDSFAGCENMEEITMRKGNRFYYTENNGLIETSTRRLIWGCQNTIIPENVVTIGSHAFYGCSKLFNLTIPNSVTLIEYKAFSSCNNLKNIIFSDNLTDISSEAFSNCSQLEQLTLPKNLHSIQTSAFCFCFSLKKIEIFKPIQQIGLNAFYGCNQLTIYYHGNEQDWNKVCRNRNSIKMEFVEDGKLVYDNGQEIAIPYGTKTIGSKQYYKNKRIIGVILPNSVISIEDYAFHYCSKLTYISFPNSLESIGKLAFACCTKLNSITLPNKIKRLEKSTFANCTGLTEVNFSDGLSRIGDSAFANCTNLMRLKFPENLHIIESYAFYNCVKLLSTTFPKSLTTIGRWAFKNCLHFKTIWIPKGVREIEPYALNCGNADTIIVENGNPQYFSVNNCLIERSSNTLVVGCRNSIIPNSILISTIGEGAFYDCDGVSEMTIPNNIKTIKKNAFNCKTLKTIRLSADVKIIETDAFEDITVIFDGTKMQWDEIGKNVKADVRCLRTAYISNEMKTTTGSPEKLFSGINSNKTAWNDNNILYIYKNTTACHTRKHNITSATAIITGKIMLKLN